MAIHELLAKIFSEIHLKKIGNIAFLNTLNYGSDCGE
jgi:hypothetical protein